MQKNGAKSARFCSLLLQKEREWGMILALNVEATQETFACRCHVYELWFAGFGFQTLLGVVGSDFRMCVL